MTFPLRYPLWETSINPANVSANRQREAASKVKEDPCESHVDLANRRIIILVRLLWVWKGFCVSEWNWFCLPAFLIWL